MPVTIAALPASRAHEAGIASGLINTSQQIGGALGVAALVTLATSRTTDAVADGASPGQAAVDGFTLAFGVASALAVVGDHRDPRADPRGCGRPQEEPPPGHGVIPRRRPEPSDDARHGRGGWLAAPAVASR